jgi:hypothetical protein
MRPNNTLKLELRKSMKVLVGFQGLIKKKPNPHNQTNTDNARIRQRLWIHSSFNRWIETKP